MSLIYNIDVKGNIKESNKLSVKLCVPFLSSGAWMVAISTVSFHAKNINLNGICHVTSNLIKGQKYSLNNRLEIYNPTIATIRLKADKNAFNIVYLEPNWFTINNINDYLELSLEHFETGLPFLHDTFINFSVLVRKIK